MMTLVFYQKNNKIKVLHHDNILHPHPSLIHHHLTLQALLHPHHLLQIQIQMIIKKYKNKTFHKA